MEEHLQNNNINEPISIIILKYLEKCVNVLKH